VISRIAFNDSQMRSQVPKKLLYTIAIPRKNCDAKTALQRVADNCCSRPAGRAEDQNFAFSVRRHGVPKLAKSLIYKKYGAAQVATQKVSLFVCCPTWAGRQQAFRHSFRYHRWLLPAQKTACWPRFREL